MTELETLARRAVDQLAASTPDPALIHQRAARRRRRHRTGTVLAATAAVTAVVAVAVGLTGAPRPGQQVATGPSATTATTTTPASGSTVPGLPAGWRKATPKQVRAALTPHPHSLSSYLATWTVTPIGTHPQTATVTDGRAANGASFYRITPASAEPGLILPHGLTVGGTYAYYFHPGATNARVSCTTRPAHTWSCVSWTNVPGVGMSVDAALDMPDPLYSAANAVGRVLAHYGYSPTSSGTTTPAYLAHRHRLGLSLTCLRFGSATHPLGQLCSHNSLITSYQLPQSLLAVDGGAAYTTIRMTSYQPALPDSDLQPPVALSPPPPQS